MQIQGNCTMQNPFREEILYTPWLSQLFIGAASGAAKDKVATKRHEGRL